MIESEGGGGIDSFDPKNWDNSFYETDCTLSNLSVFGGNNGVIGYYISYLIFVLITGYIYGRHKGLSQHPQYKGFTHCKNNIKTKLFELTSKIWFILSTFIIPWTLCIIWLFYTIHFNDINYINNYNPWISPIIIIYFLYSFIVISSYSYYCHRFKYNQFAQNSIKISIAFISLYSFIFIYVLIKFRSNLKNWLIIKPFIGSGILHCFDFNIHKNPTLFLILFMIYCLITHHIFVIIRAITAKFCHNQYISKKKKENRKKIKKKRRIKVKNEKRCIIIDQRGGIRAPGFIGHDYGMQNKYDSDDQMDELDQFHVNFDDNNLQRKPSKSQSKSIENIHLTPKPPSSIPPEFNLVPSIDPSILKSSINDIDDDNIDDDNIDDEDETTATPPPPPQHDQYL